MKITKSRLTQIIKEESGKVLTEGFGGYSAMVDKLKKNLKENDIDLWSDEEQSPQQTPNSDELLDGLVGVTQALADVIGEGGGPYDHLVADLEAAEQLIHRAGR